MAIRVRLAPHLRVPNLNAHAFKGKRKTHALHKSKGMGFPVGVLSPRGIIRIAAITGFPYWVRCSRFSVSWGYQKHAKALLTRLFFLNLYMFDNHSTMLLTTTKEPKKSVKPRRDFPSCWGVWLLCRCWWLILINININNEEVPSPRDGFAGAGYRALSRFLSKMK